MLIGYARVSTLDQTLALQQDALRRAGCDRFFTDVVSGSTTDRQGLTDALDHLRAGDVLVVWKLDRLGRSLSHLMAMVEHLHQQGIGFRSLSEQMHTTTAGGHLIFHIFGALAEFERALIRERTQAGLATARARGRVGGRRPKLTPDQINMVRQLLATRSAAEVAEALDVSRATVYRVIQRANVAPEEAPASSGRRTE